MSTPLSVTTIRRGSCTIVALVGELDLATAPQLEAELSGLDGDIHLDCRDLEFVDSSGIGVFVRLNQRCEQRHDRFVIHGLSGFVRRTFEIMGLAGVLNFERYPPPDA